MTIPTFKNSSSSVGCSSIKRVQIVTLLFFLNIPFLLKILISDQYSQERHNGFDSWQHQNSNASWEWEGHLGFGTQVKKASMQAISKKQF